MLEHKIYSETTILVAMKLGLPFREHRVSISVELPQAVIIIMSLMKERLQYAVAYRFWLGL